MSPRRHRGEIEGVVDFIDNADVRFISRLAAEEPEVTVREGPWQKFGNLRQVAFRNQFSEFVNRYHKWNIPNFCLWSIRLPGYAQLEHSQLVTQTLGHRQGRFRRAEGQFCSAR